MPLIHRKQALAFEFNPGMRLEGSAGGAHAKVQNRLQPFAPQYAINQQGLPETGGMHRAMVPGNIRSLGQGTSASDIKSVGSLRCATPGQAFDQPARPGIAEQREACMHDWQAGDAANDPHALLPGQGRPLGETTRHRVRLR